MKIYCGSSWFTRDARPRWLLHELGHPFEHINIDLFGGEGRKAEYLAINPTGKVPLLVDGDTRIFESGAILIYLGDRYGVPDIAPAIDDPSRGEYLQWLFYVQVNLEQGATRMFANRTFLAKREGAAERANEAQKEFDTKIELLEKHLHSREFLLGDRFSAADVMLGTTLLWADIGRGLEAHPVVKAYLKRLQARPAYKATFLETYTDYPDKG